MLKKTMLVAGLVFSLMAQSAWAGERGQETGTGTSTMGRGQACSDAKNSADIRARAAMGIERGNITGHSECDCSSSNAGSLTMWTCTAESSWEKR